jgi:hypothetical protein
MTSSQELEIGQEVYWNDPCNICSDFYEVSCIINDTTIEIANSVVVDVAEVSRSPF